VKPASATLLIASALVVAAAAFGSPSLYVPGIALVLLDAGVWLWVRRASRRVRVEVAPGPWSVVEGDGYPIVVRVSGSGLVPGSSLEHPLAERPLATGSRPGGEHMVSVPLPRRGRRLLEAPTLLIGDPFGLHRRRVPGGDPIPVLVLPRIEPIDAGSGTGAGGEDLTGTSAIGVAGSGIDERGVDFEVDGVRPFREGTPASRIHWPSVARSGEMVERRLISGGDSPPLVVLNSCDPDGEEALDRAVRSAASLCAHLGRGSGCSLLLPDRTLALRIGSGLRGWREAHAALALVEPSSRPPVIPAGVARGAIFVIGASEQPR